MLRMPVFESTKVFTLTGSSERATQNMEVTILPCSGKRLSRPFKSSFLWQRNPEAQAMPQGKTVQIAIELGNAGIAP